MTAKTYTLCGLAIWAVTASSQAATLVGYDFGTNTTPTTSASTVGAGIASATAVTGFGTGGIQVGARLIPLATPRGARPVEPPLVRPRHHPLAAPTMVSKQAVLQLPSQLATTSRSASPRLRRER
ncbi:hypothetical protein SH580_18845 [Coraliomargarita algicola]|uniref:Uncharacterized protein n=1 Tax=Coraliomargarita algicola TaxID=3092156 RepID=A0ABZ0RL30_9BACT|nr:hypothetical protein [Coraliomargarita sp. J2-16]WPJ95480.1 hypothetical protein SH580_18845 [Coraliomargarita sp. J2-16]